jgi:hypothetical protein
VGQFVIGEAASEREAPSSSSSLRILRFLRAPATRPVSGGESSLTVNDLLNGKG